MTSRRGPWLSGVLLAAAGAVWMVSQVILGLAAMVIDTLAAVPDSGSATVEPWPIPPNSAWSGQP